MNKTELTYAIAEKANLTKAQAKAARKGINPQTKQVIEIAARKVVKFKAGAELNDVVK